MTLSKRYLRNIKENLSFYISSTVLTIVTLLLFYLYIISGNAILDFGNDFFEKKNLEDANFTTYMPISDSDMKKLEKDYDLELENEKYVNIDTDGTTARVFKKNKKIDLYEVTVGKDIANDDEVIISEGYAVENDISVGDKIKIGKKQYRICGFFQRPDYLYMLENPDDSYKNISTFYLCYMSDNEFSKIDDVSNHYLVKYNKDNSTEFRQKINNDYYMHSYMTARENMRINMVTYQAQMFIDMSYIILVVLPLVAVALVCIIISRKVKSEQKMIGTLSALGYRKSRLMWHYAGFAAIPGVFGGILTAVLTMIFAQPYGELGLQDYEPMRIVCNLDPLMALLGVIVPTLMYILAALLSVRKLLKKDTVLLLSGNADSQNKRMRKVLSGKKASFRLKYSVRSVLSSPARSLVVTVGVFLGCFIMLLSLAMLDSVQNMTDSTYESLGSYEYQYILNGLEKENKTDGEEMLISQLETKNEDTLSVIGTSKDNKYLKFEDEDGKKQNIEDGYYVTSLATTIFGWKEGDTVKLYNPLSMKEKSVKISGVVENNVQKAIFTSINNAAKLSDLEKNTYNCLISDKKLDIKESMIALKTQKSDLGEQIDTIGGELYYAIYLMIFLAVIICISAIYVAINMSVTENRNNISMLKVLGYRDRQISKIILSVNHIFLVIGIVLSIPATIKICDLMFLMFADIDSILIPTVILPQSYLIAIALTVASYLVSLILVKRKVKKINMIESLKDNRE